MEFTEKIILLPAHLCKTYLQSLIGGDCYLLELASNVTYDKYQWTKGWLDTRLEGYPILGNYPLAVSILFCYFGVILFGPKWMENRKPLELKNFIIFYNLFLSFSNLYIAVMVIYYASLLNYSFICNPIDFNAPLETHPIEIKLLKIEYFGFLTRILELLETAIFILKKKQAQLSYLHIFHHFSVFVFAFIIISYGPRGPIFQVVVANCSIHFIMYLYYGLAALGPAYKKYTWWKVYLTRVQIMQFLYGVVMAIINVAVGCDIPRWVTRIFLIYLAILIVLFGNFYYKTYKTGKKQSSSAEKFEVGYAINETSTQQQ